MSNTTQNTLPIIAGVEITTDAEGRFNLNTLHKASGGAQKDAPSQWLRLEATQNLIDELGKSSTNSRGRCADLHIAQYLTSSKGGIEQGTFAHELLAISYAGWISPQFQLQVNRVFMDYRLGRLPQHSNTTQQERIARIDAFGRAVKHVKTTLKDIPNATELEKRAIYADVLNPFFGHEVILRRPANDIPLTEERINAIIFGDDEPQKKVEVDYINILSRFIDSVEDNIIIVSGSCPSHRRKQTDKPYILKQPESGELLARFETDTNSLYVPKTVFKQYLYTHHCTRRITERELIKAKLLQQGWESKDRYTLSKGVDGIRTVRTTCYKFILPAKLASKLV